MRTSYMDIPYATRVKMKAEELAMYFHPLRFSDYWVNKCIPMAKLLVEDEVRAYIEGVDHGTKKATEFKIEDGESLN